MTPTAQVMIPQVEARSSPPGLVPPPTFEATYEEHFAFVWRSVRALGVVEHAVDDVTQEIFLVVLKRLSEFEGRSTVRTWLYGIVRNVVRGHRRAKKKHDASRDPEKSVDPETLRDAEGRDPEATAAKTQAARLVIQLLESLDDDKREVFVLAELEQLPAKEIAELLDENINTVYSRLRLAREEFAAAAQRHRARDAWRSK
ncbi:MAG: RNA polymerase sigma factor [Polyangiaceae bacterium]